MSEQRRIASIYLSHWPIDRFFRALSQSHTPSHHNIPQRGDILALAMPMQGGLRITALTEAAQAQGIEHGQSVADAVALYPALDVREADFASDKETLKRLSNWCGRYTPWTALDECGMGLEPDGIFMDITGCAHLFGGEEALAHDLVTRLLKLGIHARIAIAATPGAAWAMARFSGKQISLLPAGQEEKALGSLSVAALRLDANTVNGLARLGLKRIDDLYGRARAPLTARFGRAVSLRLDEALGYAAEPISPKQPLVPYRARALFAEGLTRIDDIETATRQLADELCILLERYRKGARRLELLLFRVDGEVTALQIGTSTPVRDPSDLTRLFHEKLQQVGDDFDAGYGIEAISLAALVVDPLSETQTALTNEKKQAHDIDGLLDRLSNRLGAERVTRLRSQASHIPERATGRIAVMRGTKAVAPDDWRIAALQHCDGVIARPLTMLAAPEPIDVIAEMPEGPPHRFRWRRVLYQIARAEGPERIAPEWWRNARDRTRDYYRVEDVDGRRFWLYRDGLYLRDDTLPQWYIQGLFG
jgi:protein ImuB